MLKINFVIQNEVAATMNVDDRKTEGLNIVEDGEGDVDMILDEEGEKIKEQEKIEKSKLEKELQQYRIKVKLILTIAEINNN